MYFHVLVRQINLLKGPIILGVFLLLWNTEHFTEIRFPHAHLTLVGLALLQMAEAWLLHRNDVLFPDRQRLTATEWILLGATMLFCYLLVRFTGGLESKYSLIFLLPILTAATRCHPAGAFGVTFLAMALYASFLLDKPPLEPEKRIEETIELLINLFFSFVIAFVIAVANHQERRARASLERSGQRLADANRELRETQNELQRKITELENMERAVRRADRLAALGEMASGIAHELRTPLGVIQSSVETLAQRVLTQEPDNRLVKVIVEEIGRLNRLINDFLGFASPPAPRLRLQPLAPIAQRAVQLVETAAAKAGIRLGFHVPDGLLAEVDESLIHQCLLNLLVNAVDATPGGGRVELSIEAEDEGRQALITVRDTGRGVPPGEESRIFNPFYTTKEGGSGLGLAIVQQIVSLHGGRVDASSAPEGGALFSIRLRAGASRRDPLAVARVKGA
ncbi:MAG: hypothetical protein A3J27_14125 [Candidatus Tectomicrobia bacterium RIFCSPLOWO2_12_FULL_69_37]|nr:MAG: hypothetical protein A3I72_14535 [Candidatus Tectomicrobia bacterium RIFCSPLOWO2_02_FULL_70_19]OGL68917.1 MAG: hypothetical protein A3J27_14125 [Candidatus Tectomicrobia bacterium RIFCSPLOWO2_12_FULL_69_37]